ncbi:EH signature domain-containing protein [Thiocystis violacea]|uniref:EH signature domain-containing protein n=1 Tax=Thiocystis violacea TaxID=13725 RepID=UPI0019033B5E|nr:EH signature domain-containing protein [Thiocystis violacea]MBK1720483.1 hypothetical protein [Thiocystis violacea]
MTLLDDPHRDSALKLKAALSRPWRTVRFVRPPALAIQAMAETLERKFGGAPVELPPPRNLLEEVEKLLIAGRGDIFGLDRKQCKAVPYILWTSPQGWSENARLVNDYLAWADQSWRTAPRRLWRHYLLNMQPESLATKCFARWIEARADKLTPSLREFSMHWELFQPERAVAKIAGSLLAGAHLIDEITGLRVNRETLLKSACLLSVCKALGQRLRDHPHSSNISVTLKQLLASLGDNPIHKMQGQGGLGEAAQKSLVEGLVIWAGRQNAEVIAQTLDLLHTLIGDPRLYPARWTNIDPNARQTVEWWLTERTLETFFEVFRLQNAVKPQMVASREAFWRGYMAKKRISRAWLITGLNGYGIAQRLLEKSFGKFLDGAGADHLGLMLQIESYVILEMNQNGSTLLWQIGDPQMPGFFQPEYRRKRLIDMCSQAPGRFRMTHNHDWQTKYETEILRRTGVSRSG